ncbi:MAG: hypothetical protein KDK05_29425, partial [Candidatus Competibacteraceae bacterium]|nr:hypothetical protein [Candidatus Competibacteraceae bacterium]
EREWEAAAKETAMRKTRFPKSKNGLWMGLLIGGCLGGLKLLHNYWSRHRIDPRKRLQRAEHILRHGHHLANEGDYASALRIGEALLAQRFSGGFELVARVYQETGRPAYAHEVLQNGIRQAPRVWTLWDQMIGYCCEEGEYEAAWETLGQAELTGFPYPRRHRELRLMILAGQNQEEAVRTLLEEPDVEPDERAVLLFHWAQLTQKPEYAAEALEAGYPELDDILSWLVYIRGEQSEEARLWTAPGYKVRADSLEQAQEFWSQIWPGQDCPEFTQGEESPGPLGVLPERGFED